MIADRYQPIEQIGTGGMATVWKARDTLLGRFVAIKRLLPHLAGDTEAAARFKREAQAAARLSHPGIVTVFDTGEDADGPFIVQELVDGTTLAAHLAQTGAMGSQPVIDIVSQVAAALDHAHALGVIHRDIKPANLIIESDGRVRLADFGIARTVDDPATITTSGELVGTITYLAPEILAGRPATPATDIYSLGAVTFELLSGRPPYQAPTPAALLEAVRSGDVPDLRSVAPDQMSTAVSEAMAKDPVARPATAGAFAATLTGSATMVMAAAPMTPPVSAGSEEPTVVTERKSTPPSQVVPAGAGRAARWPFLLLLLAVVAVAAAAMSNAPDDGGGELAAVTTSHRWGDDDSSPSYNHDDDSDHHDSDHHDDHPDDDFHRRDGRVGGERDRGPPGRAWPTGVPPQGHPAGRGPYRSHPGRVGERRSRGPDS